MRTSDGQPDAHAAQPDRGQERERHALAPHEDQQHEGERRVRQPAVALHDRLLDRVAPASPTRAPTARRPRGRRRAARPAARAAAAGRSARPWRRRAAPAPPAPRCSRRRSRRRTGSPRARRRAGRAAAARAGPPADGRQPPSAGVPPTGAGAKRESSSAIATPRPTRYAMTAMTIAADPPLNAMTASAEITACAPPSATATARAVWNRCRVRWVRWSRPAVRIESPRRRRETITSAVSSAGMPTNSRPIASDCHAGAASLTPIIVTAATAKPTGMLPPSPRKIRAGEASRLCGRKPTAAPQSAARGHGQPRVALDDAEQRQAAGDDRGHRAGRAVHVVEQVEGVDHGDDPETLAARSTTGPAPRSQPRPSAHKPGRERRPRRRPARRRDGAAVVDRPDDPQHHDARQRAAGSRPTRRRAAGRATRKPATTAAPPRYGVGAAWPL